MKTRPVGKAGIWVALLALLLGADGIAWSQSQSTNSSASAHSAYKKRIPGSRSTIQGSRPRTYLKPKKMSYQEHMESLSTHRFKNDRSSFSPESTQRPSVLSTRSPNSAQPPSSRIKIHKSIGHPAAGLSRNEALSNRELSFLDKLSQTVRTNDAATGSRLGQIAAGQKRGQTLSRDDYEFLNAVAGKMTDGQASYLLHGIAEKRLEAGKTR